MAANQTSTCAPDANRSTTVECPLSAPFSALEETLLAQRPALLAFLRSRNAGDAAEDMLQELWLRLPRDHNPMAPLIRSPLSYLYRAANTLLIDRHRERQQTAVRDRAWSETFGPCSVGHVESPSADRVMEARQAIHRVEAVLKAQGERVYCIFRRHRVDGIAQREIAAELNISIGTVEGDLRRAYAALARFRITEGSEWRR